MAGRLELASTSRAKRRFLTLPGVCFATLAVFAAGLFVVPRALAAPERVTPTMPGSEPAKERGRENPVWRWLGVVRLVLCHSLGGWRWRLAT